MSTDVQIALSAIAMISVFVGLIGLAGYVLNGVAFMKLAHQRGMKNAWLSWIPFANIYQQGAIADNINAQYQKRTKRGITMLVLNIIMLVLAVVIVALCYYPLLDLLVNYEYYAYFGYVPDLSPMIFALLLLIPIAVLAIWQMVLQFISWYTIYKEYAPDNAGMYLALTLVAYLVLGITFVAPIIVLVIHKRVPQFVTLNSRSAYNVPNGYGYGQQPVPPQQPYAPQQPYTSPQPPYPAQPPQQPYMPQQQPYVPQQPYAPQQPVAPQQDTTAAQPPVSPQAPAPDQMPPEPNQPDGPDQQ